MKIATTVLLLSITPAYACGPTVTPRDCTMLQEVEKRMDRGKVPFLVHQGRRWPVNREALKRLGIASGREVPLNVIYRAIQMDADLAIERARKNDTQAQDKLGKMAVH